MSTVYGNKIAIQKLVNKAENFWDYLEDDDCVDFDTIEIGLNIKGNMFYDKDTLVFTDKNGNIKFALLTWNEFETEWRVKYKDTNTEDTFWNFRVKFSNIANIGRKK